MGMLLKVKFWRILPKLGVSMSSLKYSNAILRKPGRNFADGLTDAGLGLPDFSLALQQHAAYAEALRQCGLTLILLEADDRFPDGCFVEDTAIVTGEVAVITRPGNPTRRGEPTRIAETLSVFRPLARIEAPGTLDGGDVMRVENHFYIGRSQRTNAEGAAQLAAILNSHGYTSTEVPVRTVLHLKTGVTYLGSNTSITIGEFSGAFPEQDMIEVEPQDAYAANCILVNEHLLMPAGYPEVKAKLQPLDHPIIEIPMSEFEKMDGGLTCLSLIF